MTDLTARYVPGAKKPRKPKKTRTIILLRGEVLSGGVIILPILTVSESNQREHWAKKAKRTSNQRIQTATILKAFRVERPELPCSVLIRRVAPRDLDRGDNLPGSQKGIRDQIADWLGLPNDRDPRVTWEYDQRKDRPRTYGVEVEFRSP